VDNQGNVVVAGLTWNFGPDFFKHFTVAKFDRDGTLLWQQNLLDEANSVAVDDQANVVAAGALSNGLGTIGFAVAKFRPDGTLLWSQRLDRFPGFGKGGEAFSVSVDNQGNAI